MTDKVGIGRHRQVDYEERLCRSCPDCVDDEMHAIFHCRDTSQRLTYDDVLMSSSSDVRGPECLRSLLVSNPPHRVAQFLKACRNVRLHHMSHDCNLL